MFTLLDPIGQAHSFAKGKGKGKDMGMGGMGHGYRRPQLGIDRAAAVVRPTEPGTPAIALLNPRITEHSADSDEQYEGAACPSSTSAAWFHAR